MPSENLAAGFCNLQHGDYICSFVSGPSYQAGVLAPFMRESFARSERCVYITDDNNLQQVSRFLSSYSIDVDEEQELGNLVLLNKWESREGRDFDADVMVVNVRKAMERASEGGSRGLWVAVEMTWVLEPAIDVDKIVSWEDMWNDLISGLPVVLFCQYNVKRFDLALLRQRATHPFLVYNSKIVHTSDHWRESQSKRFPRTPAEEADFGMLPGSVS
ncbi:MAG: hypothetical protein FJ319_11045 [SAR202 cluster bacterium]|nr:hypothetical protein [SAR202 cluster bacterium]